MNISVASLPLIISAMLFGPLGGLLVGLLGSFLEQLLTYGLMATTVLWLVPNTVRGLLLGLYMKKKGYHLSRVQAAEFGLDPDNVMDYDFEDAKNNTTKYVADFFDALGEAADSRFKTE